MGDPSIYMSNNEVPLSKAVDRIREYLAELENRGAITDKVYFIVRACKDDFFMFRYDADEGIKEDYKMICEMVEDAGYSGQEFVDGVEFITAFRRIKKEIENW